MLDHWKGVARLIDGAVVSLDLESSPRILLERLELKLGTLDNVLVVSFVHVTEADPERR